MTDDVRWLFIGGIGERAGRWLTSARGAIYGMSWCALRRLLSSRPTQVMAYASTQITAGAIAIGMYYSLAIESSAIWRVALPMTAR